MKKMWFISFVAVGLLAFTSGSFAFFGENPKNDTNEQLAQLFGQNKAFTATALVSGKGRLNKETFSAEMDYAFSEGKLLTVVDMSKMKGGADSEGVEQMTAMGLNKIITLVRPDKKMTYVIYPGLNGYCEFPLTMSSQGTNAPPKIEKTELGRETVDGHPCVKYKVIITMPDEQKYESLVWQATDLKEFPIKSELSSGGDTVTTLFKNVKLEAPPASRFEVPAGLKKYGSVQEMMMGGIQNMMQGLMGQ
jgi:hypothetical protein